MEFGDFDQAGATKAQTPLAVKRVELRDYDSYETIRDAEKVHCRPSCYMRGGCSDCDPEMVEEEEAP